MVTYDWLLLRQGVPNLGNIEKIRSNTKKSYEISDQNKSLDLRRSKEQEVSRVEKGYLLKISFKIPLKLSNL